MRLNLNLNIVKDGFIVSASIHVRRTFQFNFKNRIAKKPNKKPRNPTSQNLSVNKIIIYRE